MTDAGDVQCQHIHQEQDGHTLSCLDCGSSIYIGPIDRPKPAPEGEPRRWALLGIVHQGSEKTTVVYLRGGPPVNVDENIDVIEYSALVQMRKERDEALRARDAINTQSARHYARVVELQREVDAMRKFNDVITKRDQINFGNLLLEVEELRERPTNEDMICEILKFKAVSKERDKLQSELAVAKGEIERLQCLDDKEPQS